MRLRPHNGHVHRRWAACQPGREGRGGHVSTQSRATAWSHMIPAPPRLPAWACMGLHGPACKALAAPAAVCKRCKTLTDISRHGHASGERARASGVDRYTGRAAGGAGAGLSPQPAASCAGNCGGRGGRSGTWHCGQVPPMHTCTHTQNAIVATMAAWGPCCLLFLSARREGPVRAVLHAEWAEGGGGGRGRGRRVPAAGAHQCGAHAGPQHVCGQQGAGHVGQHVWQRARQRGP